MSDAGNTVGFEYTLKLEEALSDLAIDDTSSVTLKPEDAYGLVKDDAFREVPIDQIPEPARQVGTQLRADGYNGVIRVHEVKSESVVLDFNHPLAGQTLTFAVRVLAVG
ncbi:MAG: hypothetical protein OEW35_02970 [Gammaproteobacteria bacterium]|nr:hypothetical protein [Gammaproteobacteria bacterium]MDH5309414.1 hypothetical protein [Gammaproteobacteria bacterium]